MDKIEDSFSLTEVYDTIYVTFSSICHSDIESIIASYRPHFGLSEANLENTHDVTLAEHEDYQLHTCTTMSNPDLRISRCMYSQVTDRKEKDRPG